MKKRLISILLSLSMVLTLLPATVLSAGVGTSKAGDATFTLSASSASCAGGHTGEIGNIQITDVDISQWKTDKKITIQYDVQYRCTDSSCKLYNSGDSFFSYSGEHTFTDTNGEFCHKKISESFTATIPTDLPSGVTKNFSVSFTLTSDKGIYESVLHEQNVNLCTENYYSVSCWECTGCGYFFQDADMSGNKFTKDKVYFPPVGHNLKHVPAKDPTCVAKGTVEHWHCERCTRNFGDEQGTSELTTIETNAPLAAHRYDADGVCEVCNRKAAAGVQANAGMVWYDTMGKALTALTYGAQLSINADYADTITLNHTCTVEVKAGVTAADIRIENAENCVVTIVNNGTISNLSGYTGKVVLMSAGGTYGSIINQTSGGNVGSFLYGDPEDANKFCYYKNLSNGKWILPAEATTNTQSNVKVSYAPMAYIEIVGDGVTGSEGSYALTTSSGNTVAFTATAKTADGNDRANVTYKWYYDGQDGTILSEKAELTIENIKAGKRTVVCMATADDYGISAKIVLMVAGEKESQSFTLSVSKTTVGIREKILPLLSVEGIKEDAAITYYLMNGDSPAPESDTVIDENFAFAQTGTGSIYAYAAETDNYAVTASSPVAITVTPHADHCICGGMFNHTHENVEWQAWDGKSEIKYEQKWVQVSEYTKQGRYVAYVYLTGNVSANLTVAPKHILYLCLNGYSFTCADPSQPAITLTGEDGKPVELDLCDCVGTGTLGGSNASGGSIRIGAYANATLYSGTLTGNNVSGDGGAVSVTGGNCSFTMYGGAITGNTATGNGGGISSYDSWNAGTVNINGGVISNNRATNGGGIYAASRTHFHLNGGEIINNTATGDGGGVYCSGLYSNADGRCEFNGSTISGNTAQRGGGAYVRVCFIGYRNCRITGNTATEAGGGLYLEPFASAKIIYMGNVYGDRGTIAPYIYDNTVNSAQNNLYLSDPDTQIVFTARINTGGNAKIGVYFTGITQNGASVLLNSLQVNTESSAKLYLDRIFCDNPDFGRLEIRKDENYYNLYLINTSDEVTITFDPNGGTLNAGDETKAVQHNGTYGEMPTPIRSGYHFDGWYTEKDGGTKVDANTSVATKEAHTLYARWSEAKYNITLDPNGGNLANATKEVTYNSPYGELPTPNRAGYDFDGWFTEKDGGTKVEASTVVTAAEPHTLYAHWTAHEHCICGGSISAGDHTGHTPVSYQSWNGNDAIQYNNNVAYVRLSDNVTMNGLTIDPGKTLYLCLNGKQLASNGTSKINVGKATKNNSGRTPARLVICDCKGGGTIKGATRNVWGGACIYLYNSTLDIFGGKITGGKVSGNGGGAIALDDSKCVLNIYGGAISDNNGKNSGGAIFLNNKEKKGGTVNMYGGTIANNTATNGGVIYSACGGTFNLSGGTISGNTANNGGVVYATSGGVVNLTLSGGTISGNKATNGDGGVINMAGGTVTISGAKLTGNTSSRYGGAVYLYNGVTATMTGGEISGNQAASEGGAVHVYGTSTFNLSGGKITGNSSVDGGAIYLNREPSVLNMSGGVISGNTATGNGGGVYIFRTGSVCNLSGGTIEKNTANVGGGIYVNHGNNGQLKISGNPIVKGNTASGDANNVYLPSGKKLSISAAMSSGASIGITTENKNYPVVFSGKYSQDYSDYFFADAADAHVNYNSNTELELAAGAKKYNVYIITDDNGTATVSASSATAGTTIQLTVTPNNGYHFKEWQVVSGNAEVSNNTFIMPAGNVTVKPVFEAHSFTEEHVEEQYKKSSADCTHNDVYYKTCSCGAVSATETFEVPGTALNHDWAEATCTEPKTCRRKGCGATDGNPLGHDLPNDWSRDENKHWHECKRCRAEEDSGEHEYGDDNICDICGYDKTVPHTHSLKLVSANNATCTKGGNKAYYACDGCDMWFEDANGSIEIADKTSVIIPATGHAPSESWKFDKADHWKDCTNAGCGVIIEGSKAAHTESGWIIDTAPTYFNSGTQHKECTVCHYVTAVGFIPAKGGDIEPSDPSGWTPNPNLPATGGDNTIFIWIALLLICASTAAGTVIHGRRKKQR